MKKTKKSFVPSKVAVVITALLLLTGLQCLCIGVGAKLLLGVIIALETVVIIFWESTFQRIVKDAPHVRNIFLSYGVIVSLLGILGIVPELFATFSLIGGGYVLLLGICILFLLSREAYMDAFVALLFGIACFPSLGLLLFWGTQTVWSVFVITLGLWIFNAILTSVMLAISELKYSKEVYLTSLVVGVVLLLAIISTILQYWEISKTILTLLLAIGGVGALAYLVYYSFLFVPQRRKKEEIIAYERDLEAKKFWRERSDLEMADAVDWQQVKELFQYRQYRYQIPKEILLKEKHLFFEISHKKREIRFNPDVVRYVCGEWKAFHHHTMDDDLLYALKGAINSSLAPLEGAENYKGYIPLIQLLNESGVQQTN